MFSRKEILLKKTGSDGIGRYDFLKQLITEFTTTTSIESKKQTLANLANFAYDPINFEFFKQLHVVDLFLAQLSEDDEDLMNFALAGLSNISPDSESRAYIISLNGVKLVSDQLSHKNQDVALNALTTLFYLFYPDSKQLITGEIVNKIKTYEHSPNSRFKNLAAVFLQELVDEKNA